MLVLSILMQNRNAKQGHKHVKSFCKQMKKSCGIDCLVLTCHKEMNGVVVTNALSLFTSEFFSASDDVLFRRRHEFMGDLGGKSFFQGNKDWDTQPIMGLLNKHANEMYCKWIISHRNG